MVYNVQSHSKRVLPRSRPLESAKVKSKYGKLNSISDFLLFGGNCNACHHLQNIRGQKLCMIMTLTYEWV